MPQKCKSFFPVRDEFKPNDLSSKKFGANSAPRSGQTLVRGMYKNQYLEVEIKPLSNTSPPSTLNSIRSLPKIFFKKIETAASIGTRTYSMYIMSWKIWT